MLLLIKEWQGGCSMRDSKALILLIVLACLQVYAADEPVTVITELTVETAQLNEFLDWVHADLPLSRGFSGNLQFDIYVSSQERGKVLFIERWESLATQRAYLAWRDKRGDVEKMRAFLVATPEIVLCRQENSPHG